MRPARTTAGQASVRAGETEFFIGLAADGAGSTTDGGKGAEITCATLFDCMAGYIQNCGDVSTITDDTVREWIAKARDAVVAEAETQGKRPREYACTVLGTIAGDGSTIFFQIGDGAVVTGSGKEYQTIFWPEQGEYANTTYFVTDENYRDHLHISHTESPDEIALFTDGLQTLVLSFALKKAHAGFFRPLFEALRNTGETSLPGFSATSSQPSSPGTTSAHGAMTTRRSSLPCK